MIEERIAAIHDAALNPGLWDATVARISADFRGAKVLLMHGEIGALERAEDWSHGIDPATYRHGRVEARRPEHNQALRVGLEAPAGHVFDRREFITDAGMDRHPATSAFFQPNRMFHLMLSTVQKDAESVSFLIVSRERREAAIEGREAAALRALAGHVGQAMRTHRALRLSEARGLAFAAALERLSEGVILADGELRVLHANAAAERMLEAGDGIARRRGRLAFGDPRAQRALETLACRLGAAVPDFGEGRIAAGRRGAGRPYAVTVAPALGDGPSALAARARMLVFIHDPEAGGAVPGPAALASAFGLTPGEARVAALAARGQSAPGIARDLGLSVNTVRSHLKAIHLKTGARGRAELVGMIWAAVRLGG